MSGERRERKLSLNLRTVQTASFERKLHAAYAAGFPAVGLLAEEIMSLGEEGLKELQLSGLLVSELVGMRGWCDVDRTSRSIGMARAEQLFEMASEIGCPLVVAGAGPLRSDVNTAAGYFREVCELAQPFAVEVALEFEGPVGESENLETAWAVVDGAEVENGGLVLDTFHFWGTESTEETLEGVPVEKLSLVQVSDSMEMPRYELRDHHRVYPGAGAIPLEPILALVAGKGYHGYYSLELANEDYWAEDPVVVARDGMRALRRVQVA